MLSWIVHCFRVPLSGLAYLSFAFGGFFLGTFVMPFVYLWPGTQKEKQRRCQGLTGYAFRLFHRYLNAIGVMAYWPRDLDVVQRIQKSIDESKARGQAGAVVVVANHPTLVDTTAIMASYPHLICVVKATVAHFPLLRMLLRLCGHIAASPSLGGETVLAEELIERLKNGESVLLFPESTRSPDSGMRPFRRGPFEIALRAQVPIQPIAIVSTPGLLKGGLAWYQLPRKKCPYTLTALEPHFTPVTTDSPVNSGTKERRLAGRQIAQETAERIMLTLGQEGYSS